MFVVGHNAEYVSGMFQVTLDYACLRFVEVDS